ncbi:MAG: phosphoribosylamine--glycine ligase [Nitrospirae bacterium]|nr:phosphoribosylamine--glycine ligase [Nitrospirota bacterium]
MNILVVGGGGREHALVWRLAQSPEKPRIFCVPGSDGISHLAETANIRVDQIPHLVQFAREERIDVAVVGPEQPLVAGLIDELQKAGVPSVGPTRTAAEIEGSKVFMKELMTRVGVKTAPFKVLSGKTDTLTYIRHRPFPQVLKVDGLAGGKGAFVLNELADAWAALGMIFDSKELAEAGKRLIVEDFLPGEEASFIVLTDGENCVPLPPAQDHKRLNDDDQGPNTGGMGAYVPAPVLTDELQQRVLKEIIRPVLHGMAQMGRPYRGFLYAGLMITKEGPSVLEFNARPGDPETQPQMFSLREDLLPVLVQVAQGRLEGRPQSIEFSPSACVVVSSAGYPGTPEKGKVIQGLGKKETDPDVAVFHAGTKKSGENWITNGGRVLGVTARGSSLQNALQKAYGRLETIQFEGMHFRKDIGRKGLNRPEAP